MSKRIGLPVVCVLLFAALSQAAYAGPILGTMSAYGGLTTIQPSSATSFSVLIAIGPLFGGCFNVGGCPQIALLQGIDSSATGTNFTLNPATPSFAAVVSNLTNGSLDYIWTGGVVGPSYGAGSGGGIGFPETDFGTSPDFAGQTISSLGLHIDGVTIQPSVGFPTLGGTTFRIDYTLTVYGAQAVPEPATWYLFATGLILAGIYRIRSPKCGQAKRSAAIYVHALFRTI